MKFRERWLEKVDEKNSLLCVGIDPAELGQREGQTIRSSDEKLRWCLDRISWVAPYAAAVKINRNYVKDLSRQEMRTLTDEIRQLGMLSIDDSKIADIGDTNDSALFHAAEEGFDAITFAPFAGNSIQVGEQGRKHGVEVISLVLMSNPEFAVTKVARFGEKLGFEHFASEVAAADLGGMVIGAPSSQNHLDRSEVERALELSGPRVILMPGVGAQGGDAAEMVELCGDQLMVNVGRSIIYAEQPAEAAERYQNQINELRRL